MSSSDKSTPKLVFPAGLRMAIGDDGLSIAHAGDIELHGPIGLEIASLEGSSISLHGDFHITRVLANGDVVVQGKLTATEVSASGSVLLDGNSDVQEISAVGSVQVTGASSLGVVRSQANIRIDGKHKVSRAEAAGVLDVSGNIEAKLLQGTSVQVGAGTLNAKGVEGLRQVVLGPAKLGVEAVVAPEVQVDAGTTGRVNVVESHNELGPNGLKGGFRLSEYAEFTGVDPEAFLNERGVRSLAELDAAPVPEVESGPIAKAAPAAVTVEELEPVEQVLAAAEPEPEPEPEPEVIEVIQVAEVEAIETIEAIEALDAGPESVAAVSATPMSSMVAQSLSADASPTVVEIDDDPEVELVEEDEPDGIEVSEEVRMALGAAVAAVSSSYAGVEEPDAVARLRELIDGGDYLSLRDEITSIWKDLIQHHQQRGKRIPHKVTATFNRINSIVRKL
ncbi:MAG: hypothetical protein H6741_06855 [Alphaproteobacteria bacterium]|nr:hypothetical protein [Alphaproteobacteria bacterium]